MNVLTIAVFLSLSACCLAAGRSPTYADNMLCMEKHREEIREEKRKAPISSPYAAGYYNASGDPCTTYCELVTAGGYQPKGQYQSPDYLTCGYYKYCKGGKCLYVLDPDSGSSTPASESTTESSGSSTPSAASTTADAGSSTSAGASSTVSTIMTTEGASTTDASASSTVSTVMTTPDAGTTIGA